jgi:hypothetical protein
MTARETAMTPAARSGLAILLGTFVILALIALPALAYQYPLSSIDIRDAFLIGNRNDDLTAALFAKYSRTLPAPETGPYVAQIELDTPYLQIARRATGALNYNSLDAVQEFQDKPLVFQVHVKFYFTSTYMPLPVTHTEGIPLNAPGYPDFWNDFKVCLIQDKEVRPKSSGGAAIFPMWGADGYGPPPSPIGGRIDVDYDPAKIDTADAMVEVRTPDGQDIEVPFDLSRLQ